MQVCAITVAYNNPKELARLLRSLQSQTSLSGLIVLDNSREEYLKENEAIFRTHADRYQFALLRPPEGKHRLGRSLLPRNENRARKRVRLGLAA